MIKIIKNNKILFVVVAIVIIGGGCLAAVLLGNVNVAMAQEQIKTAVAEASESNTAAPAPTASVSDVAEKTTAPVVSQTPSSLNAKTLKGLVEDKEMRRNYIIPSLDNVVVNQAKTWKNIEPDNFMKLKGEAFIKTVDLAKKLFGYDITDANIGFLYYTDTDKDRGDFVKVSTMDDSIVCTLTADTLDLIEIDYYFIPQAPMSIPDKGQYGVITDEEKKAADKLAAVFGTSVSDLKCSGGGYAKEVIERSFDVTTADGRFLRFATMNNTMYAVGVYPSEPCMNECVYFKADVQLDQSEVKRAAPKNFKQGQPGEGDMTKDDAKKIYLTFLNQAGGTKNYPDPAKMIFYIDNSGARENYWHIEGDKLSMDLSSKSKWIISLKCENLWNPANDLTKIGYNSMGGKEYEDYVKNIMSNIYGSGLSKVDVNAVYDDHFCTEDAWMTDGSIYEFMFKNGKLQEVDYYANEDCFKSGGAGWKADHVYINLTTGKEFIPE